MTGRAQEPGKLSSQQQPTVIEPLTYTLPQLCAALQVSERVVRQWMNQRERPLPALRSPGRIVFSKDAVRQWLVDASGPEDIPVRLDGQDRKPRPVQLQRTGKVARQQTAPDLVSPGAASPKGTPECASHPNVQPAV